MIFLQQIRSYLYNCSILTFLTFILLSIYHCSYSYILYLGIKLYSEWPTIPQLYIKGEFIGGCDIVTTMYKEGELENMLKEKKLIS